MNKLVFFVPLAVVALLACEKKPELACPKGADVTIAGNHGHSVDMPGEKTEKGKAAKAAVTGGTHEHAIVLTAENVEALARGEAVKSRTSSVNAHVHEIEVRCKP